MAAAGASIVNPFAGVSTSADFEAVVGGILASPQSPERLWFWAQCAAQCFGTNRTNRMSRPNVAKGVAAILKAADSDTTNVKQLIMDVRFMMDLAEYDRECEKICNMCGLRVTLEDSGKMGRGLFATKNIEKGLVLTSYPVDGTRYVRDGDEFTCMRQPPRSQKEMQRVMHSIRVYAVGVNASDIVFGESANLIFPFVDPGHNYPLGDMMQGERGASLGHRANDGVSNVILAKLADVKDKDGYLVESKALEFACDYLRDQEEHNNAKTSVFNGVLVVGTSRNIKKGEQVFLSYGPAYWLLSVLAVELQDSDEYVAKVRAIVARAAKSIAE
jgi:hypothetical protein